MRKNCKTIKLTGIVKKNYNNGASCTRNVYTRDGTSFRYIFHPIDCTQIKKNQLHVRNIMRNIKNNIQYYYELKIIC